MNRQIYYHRVIDSTNDEAKRLIEKGEPHGTLIIADEQTAGRGRSGRSWVTPPMSAVAMSLILRPTAPAPLHLTQISLLGGLVVLEGIRKVSSQQSGVGASLALAQRGDRKGAPLHFEKILRKIMESKSLTSVNVLPTRSARGASQDVDSVKLKWPNDVLINGSKVAGVLAESLFVGDRLEAVIVGMGVNVNAAPPPDLKLEYPATCLADVLGHQVNRENLITAIIESFDARYSQLGTKDLTEAWSAHLAMKGQGVQVLGITETTSGTLEGVTSEGALLIRLATGEIKTILAGDVHLRAKDFRSASHETSEVWYITCI
ncbi:MAG: biotin--[acetyl-CoA-carboxylase] ligase [Chloroflexi bacterium]|nr:biotin--[acetyl-CoA-carboxylase] ligase [Chloroflexota bacterium]